MNSSPTLWTRRLVGAGMLAALTAFSGPATAADDVDDGTLPTFAFQGDVGVCDVDVLEVSISNGEVFLVFDEVRWQIVDGTVLLGLDQLEQTTLLFDVDGTSIFVSVDGNEKPALTTSSGLASYVISSAEGIYEFEVDHSSGAGIRVPTVPDVIFEPVKDCPPSPVPPVD